MKRTKRILSLLICLLFTVTSLPATQFAAFAYDTTENIVSLQETTWKNVSDLGWTLNANASGYVTPKLDENGHFMFEQTETTGTGTNKGGYGTRSFGNVFVIAEDNDNRTEVLANKIDGKYTIELDLDLLIKRYEGTSVPYYALGFTSGGNEVLSMRMRSDYIQVMDNPAKSSDSVYQRNTKDDTETDWGYNPATEANNLKVKFDIDTVNSKISTYLNGNLLTKINNAIISTDTYVEWGTAAPLDGMKFTSLSRADVGTFLKINELKVTQIARAENEDLDTKLADLPATLGVADINNVTETSITLPAVDGVTWSSSDSSLIEVNGTSARVNRVKGEKKEVSVIASFTVNETNYKKVYNLTLAEGNNIVTYYGINGDVISKAEVVNGNKASEISAPLVEHYNFIGWYEKDATTAFDFNTAINDHVDLYAKYELKTYNVYFKKDGELVKTLTGKYGSTVNGVIPEIPEKDGYTAVGWVIDGTEVVFSEATIIDGDIVANATYVEGVIKKHTVKFVVDGNVYVEEEVVEGCAVGMPVNPEKENYVFEKWQLNGADYSADAPIVSDITLNAVFKPVEFTVTFYDDDKTTKLYDGKGYYNEKYTELPEMPSKSGYKFTGWVLEDGTTFNTDYIITKAVSVYATYASNAKVIYDVDFTKIKTKEEAEKAGWIFKTTEYADTGVFSDGGVGFWQIKSMHSLDGAAANGTTEIPLAAKFAGVIEEDKDNRTVLKVTNIRGTYQLDLSVEVKIDESYPDDYTGKKSSSFALFKVGTHEGNNINALKVGPLQYRVYNNSIDPYNASSSSDNTFKVKLATKSGEEYVLHILSDTLGGQVTTWVDDGERKTANAYEDYSYINGISVTTMHRFGVGSYMKFKNAKITLLEEDTESNGYTECMEAIAELPEKLCDNPFNVTEDIELKEIKNVKWSSSHPSVISDTGKVTNWYDDTEVVITATINLGSYKYVKEYTLTVPKNHDITSEVKLDKEFNSEADLLNWYFPVSDSEDVEYKVDENGIVFEKISSSADLTTDRKNIAYNAFFDLYTEESDGIYTSDNKGVYDVDLSLMANITSKAPATLSLGYRSGNRFYNAGTLDFTEGKVAFKYRPTLEKEETVEIANTQTLNDYKLRIDTVNNKLWIFAGNKNITPYGVSFVDTMPADMDFIINSLRVSMDKNNANGDYVLVNSVKLTKHESVIVENLSSAVSAAKSLAANTVTSNADALEGYINNLPETTGKYNIEWKSSSKQIDMQTGEVYHSANAIDAVVSAYVSDSTLDVPVVVRRDFNVTIRAAKNTEELTKFELNGLGNITNQPYNDIRYDIYLPEIEGVVWTSTDTSVVSNDGKINRKQTLYEDKNVTLKATKNGVVKEYPITVSKYSPFNVVASGTDVAGDIFVKADGIDTVVFTGDILVNLALEAGETNKISLVDSNNNVIAKIIQSDDGVVFDYASSNNKKYVFNGTANISVYVMSEKGKISITMNGELVADYVGTKTEVSNFEKVVSETKVKSVEIYADAYSRLQANADNIDYDYNIEKGYLVKDIEFVNDTIFGVVAKWASSDEGLVSADGKVTNKDNIKHATITLTLNDGEDSNINLIFNNKVAVDVAESRNIAENAKVIVSSHESLDAPKNNVNDNNIDTSFVITEAKNKQYIVYDFNNVVTFNTLYVNHDGNLNDYVISVSADSSTWKDVKTGSFNENIESRVINLDEIQTARYLRFTSINAKANKVAINELRVYLIGDADDLAKIDIGAISLPKNVTDDIELPKVGLNGTKFIWSTSDENVIDAEGNVTTPEKAVIVVLTVQNEERTISRAFNVTVKGKGSAAGPSVVGGGSGSGGGGGAGGSAGASTGMFPGVKPGDSFGAGETVEEPEIVKPSTTYSDVNKADWYYEPVMKLTEMGVVSGDGTGMFNPKDCVTREQFVKMIIIAAGIELSDNTNTFDDVNSGEWYEDYVATAVSTGIVNGVGNGRFGIGTDISRQDMAVIISRILEKKGHTFDEEFEKFKDDKNISEYAYDAVYTMKGLGIIEGFEGNFNPKDNLTRAEAAKVIVTLTEILESK